MNLETEMTRIHRPNSSVLPVTQAERLLYAHALRSLRAYEVAAKHHDESGMAAARIAVVDASSCLGHGLERILHRAITRIRTESVE